MRTNLLKTLAGAVAVAATLAASPAAAQEPTAPLDEELDNYWSVDRDLPVVQDRLFSRDNRLALGVYAGVMSSEPFYWYIPVGGRLSYFLNDHVGIELGGQWMGGESEPGPLTNETEITGFFANRLGEAFDPATDLEDRFMWRANATLLWMPFYGKWSFLNNKLSHFDFNLALGGGALSVLRPDFNRTEATTVITPELTFGGGIHFFLGQHWTLRADGRFYAYQGANLPSTRSEYNAQEQEPLAEDESNFFGRLQVPSEFLLGISYLF